jgi:hypothetical protein
MTFEEVAAIADEHGTVDVETYRRLVPDRFVPENTPPNVRAMLLYPRPRSTSRRAVVGEVLSIFVPWWLLRRHRRSPTAP